MAPDYSKLLDREVWAFIECSDSYYPPDKVDYTIEERRAIYDRMCREFFAGYPKGVAVDTGAIAEEDYDIPIRTYRAEETDDAALVLYFHGGGFVLGGLESHDDVCAELCMRTGYEVVSVDYRLAPENPHPAAFDDALAAFEWAIATSGRNIVLCGDSAGGNLAAGVSHATRGHKRRPTGQVLIYPTLGGDCTKGSYVTHAEAPMLTVRDMTFYDDARAGGADASDDIAFAPLKDANFANLPPTVIVSAECDPLSSDGQAYRERMTADGGRCVWFNEKGLVHGYLRARHTVGRARTSFTRIVEAVKALGKGEWIY
ncbi:MAG: alpha/beta hydrolase [Hyphomicrobiales bacterium]|nr:alpha/beta hydrolase [Hyphomicrobiales bacterium]